MIELQKKLDMMAQKIRDVRASLSTEGATKTALVMPFIQHVLGYDVFDPKEVIPEYTADAGVKKAEKVDYALSRNGVIQALVECKKAGELLSSNHTNQLFRYFSVTQTKIAILTNGVEYRFYTDIETPNIMDNEPFFVLDLTNPRQDSAQVLAKLSKNNYHQDAFSAEATELKHINGIMAILRAQLTDPDDDFVKLAASKLHKSIVTPRVKVQFQGLSTRAASLLLSELRTEHVVSYQTQLAQAHIKHTGVNSKIVTTEEEIAGFNIIKAILCDKISHERIVGRDTQSYFGVILDDNNRKPLARLHFNGKQKYLGVFAADKTEVRHPIKDVYAIYEHKKAVLDSLFYCEQLTSPVKANNDVGEEPNKAEQPNATEVTYPVARAIIF